MSVHVSTLERFNDAGTGVSLSVVLKNTRLRTAAGASTSMEDVLFKRDRQGGSASG
jgi:hypothetical protein